MPLPNTYNPYGASETRIWELVYAQTFTGLYAAGMAAVEPESLTAEEIGKISAQARDAAGLAVAHAYTPLLDPPAESP